MATQQGKKNIVAPLKSTQASTKPAVTNDFAFGKENYMLMIIGIVVLVIGYMLMVGGNPQDPTAFSTDIFSFRRITLAPVVIMIGFAIEVAAIVYKSKE